MSAYYFPALTVADELGLFELLDVSPCTVEDVATNLSISHRGAEGLLGLLSSLGFAALTDRTYQLTTVSREYMLPSSRYYWGPMLRLYQDPPIGHNALLEALLKDRRIDRERSTKEWSSGELDQERAGELTAGMHSHSLPAATGVAKYGDFHGVRQLLDVGGGSACFCIALANEHKDMQFTVLELPAVCEFTLKYIRDAGFEDRISIVASDMFKEPWPVGHDAILLSNILHDWDQERCLWLCRRCCEVLPAGGSLYVHTMLLSNRKDSPLTTAAFSMNMVVRTEGRQFSKPELEQLLRISGFSDLTFTNTFGYYSLIRARKRQDGG